MKILILFLLLLLFPSFSHAAESGFFFNVQQFISDIWHFLTITIPDTVTHFFVVLSTYVLYIKFYLLKSSLEFSHAVAIGFLSLVDISSVINSAIGALPSDLRQVAIDVRFFDSLTLVVEAFITRLVYQSTS